MWRRELASLFRLKSSGFTKKSAIDGNARALSTAMHIVRGETIDIFEIPPSIGETAHAQRATQKSRRNETLRSTENFTLCARSDRQQARDNLRARKSLAYLEDMIKGQPASSRSFLCSPFSIFLRSGKHLTVYRRDVSTPISRTRARYPLSRKKKKKAAEIAFICVTSAFEF